jgi:hypothetical protein
VCARGITEQLRVIDVTSCRLLGNVLTPGVAWSDEPSAVLTFYTYFFLCYAGACNSGEVVS